LDVPPTVRDNKESLGEGAVATTASTTSAVKALPVAVDATDAIVVEPEEDDSVTTSSTSIGPVTVNDAEAWSTASPETDSPSEVTAAPVAAVARPVVLTDSATAVEAVVNVMADAPAV
jgi:hypothetical protein